MHKSILDAIREGTWDYEPDELPANSYASTKALPGSAEKLAILANRAEKGLPLWHDSDRRDYEDGDEVAELGPSVGRRSELMGTASPRD